MISFDMTTGDECNVFCVNSIEIMATFLLRRPWPWLWKMWHDNVIKWKYLPRYWPFVRVIHRSLVNYPHKGQWRGALMFSSICVWITGWVNNRVVGELRRYRAHSDVIVMKFFWVMYHISLQYVCGFVCCALPCFLFALRAYPRTHFTRKTIVILTWGLGLGWKTIPLPTCTPVATIDMALYLISPSASGLTSLMEYIIRTHIMCAKTYPWTCVD